MSPAANIVVQKRPTAELSALADASLSQFEDREIQARAYIAPAPRSILQHIFQLPQRLLAVFRTIQKSRRREYLRYTEDCTNFSVSSAVAHLFRKVLARRAILDLPVTEVPPDTPFVLFGLHFQPESSIDVWAPFFSDQKWVVELLSRSIPPTHKLLIKIHKSDVANHSRAELEKMLDFPGVELVAPFADTRSFIEHAALIVAIQGTMGLEGALIGKPVIMLGKSPVTIFPSAKGAGALRDLPSLVRKKLVDPAPDRAAILEAYAEYLAPFFPASRNEWNVERTADEIAGYVNMFDALNTYLATWENKSSESTVAEMKK